MNICNDKRSGESGSVLMVALVIGGILGITLASYLMLMQHQNSMVVRGQAWNHALALAEAGVEDAMAQINRSFGTNNSRGGINGWSGSSSGPASLTRTLSGGSYSVSISSGMPVITSTGRVAVANSSKFIERQVRVFCRPKPAFEAAMVAKKDIVFSGNNVEVDSYDSLDPNHSTTNGMWNRATRKAGGDVASTEGFISVGNAEVKGKLYTGPINANQYLVGPSGSVGDLTWNGPGVQPGWYFNDFNQDFTPLDEPYPTAVPPPSGVGATNWLLTGGEYKYDGNFSANSGKIIYVSGAVTVYVTGGFSMKGKIVIGPGASLKLYVGGASTTLNEVNTSGNAKSFQYFGLPTNKGISWSGNDTYVGTVYAPQASMKLGGGGSSDLGFQGSCVVEALAMNGHFKFHFDEALRKGTFSGYVVSLWKEE